jgi:hypothetical protein
MECEKKPQYLIEQLGNDPDSKQDLASVIFQSLESVQVKHVQSLIYIRLRDNYIIMGSRRVYNLVARFHSVLEVPHATARRCGVVQELTFCLHSCGTCCAA